MAELSGKDRKELPDEDFAEPDERKYPIEDEAHARNALARVAQHGTKEEQEAVRKRVEERYPDLEQD